MKRYVAIVSGGMDSAVLAYHCRQQCDELHMLTFDYGQRHEREILSACHLYERMKREFSGVSHDIIELTGLKGLLKGSALTDSAVAVPHGHYEEESMRLTVVPNRNAIMLSVAWGVAVAEGAKAVAVAVHAGDHHIYPDCRPEFIRALDRALRVATEGHRDDDLTLFAPFLFDTKADIVKRGVALSAPFDVTWTCYEGGERHCGQCGACRERREAFQLANVPDPTVYVS